MKIFIRLHLFVRKGKFSLTCSKFLETGNIFASACISYLLIAGRCCDENGAPLFFPNDIAEERGF